MVEKQQALIERLGKFIFFIKIIELSGPSIPI